ncbi:MAG: TlpA disulfide reductase family protein [Flavobacterium sp.]|nr:TlpA disulfide reductase family protein [Flavobacterium sp.]
MKKVLLLLAAVAIVSCNKAGDNEYIITGTVKGIEAGKVAILQKQDPLTMQIVPLDTVKIEDGKFSFKGSAKEPEITFVDIAGKPEKVLFILENGDLEMVINKDSIGNTKTTGTYNNEELNSFKATSQAFQKKVEKFKNDNMAKMNQAQQTKDTVTANGLMKQYRTLQEEFSKKSEDYVATHPKAFISVLLMKGMFQNPDLTKIKKLYDGLDKSIKDTKPGKDLKKRLDELQKMATPAAAAAVLNEGAVAPDFTANTPDGKIASLKTSLGKLTIVDFWASWCGPCRQENPNVVALYKEFHAKGLNIVGVSLDDDAAAWKTAIEKDGLLWTQVSNLKKWKDPIALQYGIDQIPATFLLDASGKIIARDLRGDALKAKVASLLK